MERGDWIEVPDLIGLPAWQAWEIAEVRQFSIVPADQAAGSWSSDLVVRQVPGGGELAERHSVIVIWTHGPDEEGVREPRDPDPPLRQMPIERDEPFPYGPTIADVADEPFTTGT